MKLLFLLLLFFHSLIAEENDSGIYSNFQQENYEEALLSIEDKLKVEGERESLLIWKSILLNYILKAKYERKDNYFSLLFFFRKIFKYNEELLERFPEQPFFYTSLAENYHYLPSFLGGDIEKAEKYILISLKKKPTSYQYLKSIIFFLNIKKDYQKVKALLDDYDSNKNISNFVLDKIIKNKIIYQKAVYYFETQQLEHSQKLIEQYIDLEPMSYWGYYIALCIDKKNHPKKALSTRQQFLLKKTYKLAIFKKNFVLIDRLKKEGYEKYIANWKLNLD